MYFFVPKIHLLLVAGPDIDHKYAMPAQLRSSSFIAFVFILVAISSIQAGASIAKGLFPVAGPLGTSALRLTFAALSLLLVWRPWRVQLSPAQKKTILIYGASLGCMNLVFYLALVRLPLGITVAIEFIGPLGVAIWASRRALDLVWVGLAALGIWLISPLSSFGGGGSLDLLGIFYAALAGLFWAFYIVFGQKTAKQVPGGVASSLGMTVAALVVVPIGGWDAGPRIFDLSLLPFGLAIGVLSSAIPYSLEMYALKHLRTHTFGVLMSLEPAVAALSGLLFLGEQLSRHQWMAILCVIAASLGSSLTSNRKFIDGA